MSKGTLRPLFQAAAPPDDASGETPGDFLIVEAVPKPDAEDEGHGHRYWGVFTRPDGSGWVSALHADVIFHDGDALNLEDQARLMSLRFSLCPAAHVASVGLAMGALEPSDLPEAGSFLGNLGEWAESIGYDILDVPDDDDFAAGTEED